MEFYKNQFYESRGRTLTNLFEYFRREWGTVKQAPGVFALGIVVIFAAAYGVASWRYGQVIDLLRERIANKDQEIENYREKLHLAQADGNEFTQLTHTELRDRALKFVVSLREWLAERKLEDSQQENQGMAELGRAKEDAKRAEANRNFTANILKLSIYDNNEYDAQFKIRSIGLRDEMLARMKDPDPKAHPLSMYKNPTNLLGMGMVADDLESLARKLP